MVRVYLGLSLKVCAVCSGCICAIRAAEFDLKWTPAQNAMCDAGMSTLKQEHGKARPAVCAGE